MSANSSLFEKAYNPFLQGGVVLGGVVVIMLLTKMMSGVGVAVSPGFYWQITGAFLLFYALFNSIFSLSAKNTNRYWSRSILCFAGLAAVSALLAQWLSGQSINEAGSYRWIFLMLAFCYLVFLTIMNVMKNIVRYAEKEDWQAPRKRKK